MARKRPTPELDAPPTLRKRSRTPRTSKRSSSSKKRTSTPSKRKPQALKQPRTAPPAMETQQTTPPPKELSPLPPSKKRKKHAHFADPVSVSFLPSAVQSPPRTTRKPSRYTFEFFQDMAETIASHFPFEAFAAKHRVSLHDVSKAFSAVVVAPLTDPAFPWHDDPDMTIPEYAEIMIRKWDAHCKKILTTHALDAAVDHENETLSSEDSDGSCNGQDDEAMSAESCCSREASPSTQDNQSASLSSPAQVPQTPTEEPHDSPAKKIERTPYPKWSPPATPSVRQHVYRDEYGNFVPVPTAEEQEEHQLRQWGREQCQRSRGRQGRSHTSMSFAELEEWFERELASGS